MVGKSKTYPDCDIDTTQPELYPEGCNVYAKQLFPLRHGYPLWHPEGDAQLSLEGGCSIGDVGFLYNGAFNRFFNATLGANDATHKQFGVPLNHTPLQIATDCESRRCDATCICSRGVSSFGPDGKRTTATTPVGEGIKFQCSGEMGAFLFTNAPAETRQIHMPRSFISSMRDNIDRWYEWAEKRDLNVTRNDIMFVSGVTTATDWGLGAFINGDESYFVANVGRPFSEGRFEILKVRPEAVPQIESNLQCRLKPTDLPQRDQTLFFHYYKLKDRTWDATIWKKIKRCIESVCRTAELEAEEPYDPVDILLDYLLAHTTKDGKKGQVAIASDLHIYAAFKGEVPLDIQKGLADQEPEVILIYGEVACLAAAEWAEEPYLKVVKDVFDLDHILELLAM